MRAVNRDDIGKRVRVYCSMCHKYMNGILLDFDDSCVPYTVATRSHHLPGAILVGGFTEIEFVDWVDWEDAYACKKEK